MKRLVEFAVHHPVTIFMVTVAALVFGTVALGRLDVRLLPEIHYPSLTIQTEYPNTAPVDVENLVTRPLEESVGVVPGIRKVHSISQAGLSQVTLEFNWDSDMDYSALEVREKIDLVTLPEESETPVLLKYDPSLDPVLRIGLSGKAPLVTLRNVAEDVLKKEIESLSGVAAAKVSGGLEEEIQVQVDESRLSALGISIDEVNAALAQENVNASGGRLRDRNAEYLVRTLSRFENLDAILDVTVANRDGQPIRLADVAEVHRGHKERTTITHVDGRESVELAIYKEGDENIVDVANRVRNHLRSMEDDLPAGLTAEILFDQSVFISQAISEVRSNALLGGLFAVLVLYLFLRDLRSTLIIGLSIPVSIVATFILMYSNGVSLNVMSLGGLALGVGMLVDNSIVVLESMHRERERRRRAGNEDGVRAVTDGAGSVAGAVVASTLTTVAVFVPVVFVVEGISGQIFGDQALTVTFSLMVSLLVALSLTPMLVSLGARRRRDSGDGELDDTGRPAISGWRDLVPEGGRMRWFRIAVAAVFVAAPAAVIGGVLGLIRALHRGIDRAAGPVAGRFAAAVDGAGVRYRRLLDRALHRRGLVMGAVAVTAIGAAFLFGSLGAELLPPLAQGQVTLALELPEGTPLSRTDATVAEIGRRLAKVDGVERVAANVGVSQEGGGSVSRRKENRADLHLKLTSAREETEEVVLERSRAILRDFPGAEFRVRRPSLLSLSTPLEVDVYGYDLERIMETADRVAAEMATVRGVRDVQLAMVPGSPEIRVTFDRDRLNRYGLTLSSVASTLRNKVRGSVASQYRDQEKHIDIRVLNDDDQRNTLTAIRDLIVAERDGIPIRLATIASMEIVQGPSEIHRLSRRRVAIVTANLSGRDLASASTEIDQKLAGLALPAGVSAELGGQNDELQRSFRSLRMAILLAIFLVYLVMASQFESFLYPFIIMFTVPLALVGAVLGLKLTGTPLSVVAAIGAIMLAGIVVNNGIVLVDRINQYRKRKMALRAAVLEAGAERFRPIIMTTITTVLGLLPMALGLGEGAELRAPLAITVIWGLLFATLLTLLVVPVMYTLLTPDGGIRAEAPARRGAAADDRLAPAPGGGGGR